MRGQPTRRGITLVEVMMAMTILSIVFTGAMIVLTAGFQMLHTARHITLAGQLLQNEMEALHCMEWEDVTALPESSEIPITSPFPEQTDDFACTRNITPLREGMVSATVTITWQSRNGITHARSLFTRISNSGISAYYR